MDLRKLKTLLSLMEEHGLAEMEIEEEGEKIRLSKAAGALPPVPPPPGSPSPARGQGPPQGAADAGQPAPRPGLHEIKSPIVGTFYRAAKPGDPPFAESGKRVAKDATLCIIEAMKVMNEIKSDVEGVVEEVLVENGAPVEYGQVLIRIRT